MSKLEEIYSSLTSILNELLQFDNEILGSMLVNTSGQLIAYSVRHDMTEPDDPFYFEALGATISAVFGAVMGAGTDFNLGNSNIVLAEFSKGRIVITNCDLNTILAIITTPNAALGSIRLLAKKYTEKLKDILNELYLEIEKALKEISPSELSSVSEINT